MYIPKKIHSGFVGSLFVIALVVLFFFYTRPTQNQINSLRETVNQLQTEVQDLTKKGGGEIEVTTVSEVEQKELVNVIPQTLEEDIIVSDLNRILKTAEVSFNALTFSLQRNADIPTVNISGSFQGGSSNIIKFLKMLESNPRKFVVRNTGVSRTTTKEGLEVVNLNLSFQAFYRKDA